MPTGQNYDMITGNFDGDHGIAVIDEFEEIEFLE